MTAVIQTSLWLFVLCSLWEMISPKIDILKERIKYKKAAKMYMRLSRKADSDYKSGFFYGKAKLFEQKLSETRYFDYE